MTSQKEQKKQDKVPEDVFGELCDFFGRYLEWPEDQFKQQLESFLNGYRNKSYLKDLVSKSKVMLLVRRHYRKSRGGKKI